MSKKILPLVCLLSLIAGAESWRHQGNRWTSCNGVQLSIPSSLKAEVDEDGILSAENDDLSLSFLPLPDSCDFQSFSSEALSELNKEFKNIKWSKAVNTKSGSLALTLQEGHVTQSGVQMEITLAQFLVGKRRLGVMTVQEADDGDASALTSQVMGTIQFK